LHAAQKVVDIVYVEHFMRSGAGTNFKVGRHLEKTPEIFFSVVPLNFLAPRVQVVVLVSEFVIGSTVWSVYRLLHGVFHA